MQNVAPIDIGLTPSRDLPGIVRRVPTAPSININGGNHVCPMDANGVPNCPNPGPIRVAPQPGGGITTQPVGRTGEGPPPGYVQCTDANGNTITTNSTDNCAGDGGIQSPGNPLGGTPSSGNGTPGNTTGSNSSDSTLQAILNALNGGGGGGGGSLPASAGLTPSGFIGSGQTSSGSSAPVIIVVVILAVAGYYLWEKYKGKLKKHEEAPA